MSLTNCVLEFRRKSFKEQVSLSGIACYGFMSKNESAAKIAEFAGVSKRTASRWLEGAEVPLSVIKLIEMTFTGGIPQDGIWKGYTINSREELVSPEGHIVTPSTIKRMYLDKWYKESQDVQIRELKRTVEQLRSIGLDDKRQEIIRLANEMLSVANEPSMREVI